MKKSKDWSLIVKFCVLGAMLLLIVFSKPLFGWGDALNISHANMAPCREHLFGTDNFGRDMLCRSFIGLRLSLLMAFIIQVICLVLGVSIGTVVGYSGGLVDKVFVVVQNVILSFPGTVLTLCVMLLLGTGTFSMIVAMSIFGWLSYARLTRSRVISLREANFIKGELAIGSSRFRILFFHIVPNVIRTIIPIFTLMIGHMVLAIAGLSFLGFGVQPPNAEIGLMIQDGMVYLRSAPWMFIFPGLILAVYSVMFNVVGDALQDRFDPHEGVNASRM